MSGREPRGIVNKQRATPTLHRRCNITRVSPSVSGTCAIGSYFTSEHYSPTLPCDILQRTVRLQQSLFHVRMATAAFSQGIAYLNLAR